ncbi:MAG: AAA family ATPase [Sulfolobaceae archaeon]
MDIAVYCGNVFSWTDEVCRQAQGKYTILDYDTVINWVNSHSEGYLVFGTDVIPYSLFDYPRRPINETPIFKFMERGGIIIWAGDVPFLYVDREGKKEGLYEKGITAFPFGVLNLLGNNPVSITSENTIVGDMLNYEPKDSWRPVEAVPSLIPISTVRAPNGGKYYSTWIYKYGKGMFVRVYDSQYVNAEYVLSLPQRISQLGVGLRIKNFRRFKDFKLVLPKFKIAVILGKNNVGKTSILEAIGVLKRDNLMRIKSFRGNKLTEGTSEVELYYEGQYYEVQFTDTNVTSNKEANVLLIYSHNFEVPPVDQGVLRRAMDILNKFDPNIFYVYLSARNEIRVLFSDKTDLSIHELGYGYKSLLSFILNIATYNPEIILIDDLESFAFHPELLKQFYDFLLKLNVGLVLITTQSSDIYAYLAEKRSNDVIFVTINDDKYMVFSSEEIFERLYYEDLRYTALRLK